MATSRESSSVTPIMESTETDGAHVKQESSHSPLRDEEWRAMKTIIDALYDHREQDGHDPSKIFHRKVNKRIVPDYYDVIKEPIAMSTLKAKLNNRDYRTFAEFVRDCALISHNAQTYNRPEAQAYQDALSIKGVLEATLQNLADQKVIAPEVAILPDLGEIPPADPQPPEEEDDDDDDDDEDDEDDEIDESEDEGGKKKRRRGRPSAAAIAKREAESKDDGGQKAVDTDARRKRGRPPRVDTPMEARIKAVLKGIRKPKNDLGQIMIHHFEKLPDKATMPEYFVEIKEPIAIELIKRKQKRKKYQSVDHFMKDVDTMFNNAKSYNQDESQIYKDAVVLQSEAHKLAEQEKLKPDTDYVMEEGRLPLPNGILHNGELWKVGDWVHIQNPNDVTKPIVAQIYRTWQDTEGQKWVNACWYYRPEQTIHQYEKHFYPSEVVKTGQYRDHHIDEIIDRCFVMFFTRYSRGRPRGLPADKEVYVCEARYNEEKHKLNKIKTWASCLPDEVRDKDYEMDLFEGIRKVKKVPSPLLHMLKEDAKEDDDIPKPRWGADNAPPVVGAVHKGARDENQSPPPEPTPSPPPPPPPPPPPQPARQVSNMSTHETNNHPRNSELENTTGGTASQAFTSDSTQGRGAHAQSSYTQQPTQQYHQHSASPAPLPNQQYSQPIATYAPQTHHNTFPPTPHVAHVDQYSTPQSRYTQSQMSGRIGALPGANLNASRAVEVYHLSDSANLSIPEDIREQFHRDEHGRVLFFTTPPLDVLPPVKKGEAMGHSVRYMAEMIRRENALKEKRKQDEVMWLEEETKQKRARIEDESSFAKKVKELTHKAVQVLGKQLADGTDNILKEVYGNKWEEGKELEKRKLEFQQNEQKKKLDEATTVARSIKEKGAIPLRKGGVFLDDIDPRF